LIPAFPFKSWVNGYEEHFYISAHKDIKTVSDLLKWQCLGIGRHLLGVDWVLNLEVTAVLEQLNITIV